MDEVYDFWYKIGLESTVSAILHEMDCGMTKEIMRRRIKEAIVEAVKKEAKLWSDTVASKRHMYSDYRVKEVATALEAAFDRGTEFASMTIALAIKDHLPDNVREQCVQAVTVAMHTMSESEGDSK